MKEMMLKQILATEEGIKITSLKRMWGLSYSEVLSFAEENDLIVNGDKIFAPFIRHLIFKVYGRKH